MELIKKNIHTNREKCRSNLQITLDNDINIPDIKPDVEMIVREQGEIKVQDIKVSNGRVSIKGELIVNILYIAEQEDNKVQHMVGNISFNENVNMSDTCDGDAVNVKWELDDLTADIINSRKISVKSILNLIVCADEIIDEEAAVEVCGDINTEQLYKEIDITELALNKKDIYRIKDEIILTSGRDSIQDILFSDVVLEETDIRISESQLNLRGNLRLFILYTGAGNGRVNAYEANVGFSGAIDCNGCDESMIPKVEICIQDKEIQVKEDEDGEDRIIDIEAVLGIDIKVHREEKVKMLEDMYTISGVVTPVFKSTCFNNLIMKNNSKARINEHIVMEEIYPPILQVCNTIGNVRIDEKNIVSGGIEVEGIIEVKLLYFTDEENYILGAYKGIVPFNYFVEVKDIHENCTYEISTNVEQINVIVIDGREIEVKATVGMDVIVFEKKECNIIVDFKEEEENAAKLLNIPGMTGYIVQKNDRLWDIAKEYSTTMELIREMNGLESDEISEGMKLLLIKEVR